MRCKFHGKGFHHDWIVNWVDPKDKITWDIDVVETGETIGLPSNTLAQRKTSDRKFAFKVNEAKSSKPYCGKDFRSSPLFPNHDRAPRAGELEKPWATLELGKMELDQGITKLVLSADRMPGTQVMEVREVILERIL